MGVLRLGSLLRFIPYPVVAGFTSGIAVIIFVAQLNEGLGLGLKMPQHLPQQLYLLASHLPAVNGHALGITVLTLVILYGWPKLTAKVPASIVAVVVATLVVYVFHLPVATIGSKFGGIPLGWPRPPSRPSAASRACSPPRWPMAWPIRATIPTRS
jgi:SulP family sulfate permease